MKKINIVGGLIALLFAASCSDDFLDIDSRSRASLDQISDLANSSPEAALGIAEGLEGGTYFFMNDFATSNQGNLHDDFGHMAFNIGLDLMSNDMIIVQSNWFVNYYNYTARNQTSVRTNALWRFYYKIIQDMTGTLAFIPEGTVDEGLLNVRGRVLALRGFAYFQLIRVYGDGELGIPLLNEDGFNLARQPEEVIKNQILSDLEEAHELLEGYERPSKVIIDQSIVAGLLARYHLEYENWSQAAAYAVEARGSLTPMDPSGLFDGFNKIGNPEWMWGADITQATSTVYASFFSHMDNTHTGYAGALFAYKSIDRRLFEDISPTDYRRLWFVDPEGNNPYAGALDPTISLYANTKFIDDTNFVGDYVFMRAAEMYLIEAEAKAEGGDEAGARQALFELISTRDPNYALSANSGADLINEIRTHRRIELWGEGFAFFDMKRWNMPLVRNYPGTNHNSLGLLDYPADSPKFNFQIPISEINNNPELGAQNPL